MRVRVSKTRASRVGVSSVKGPPYKRKYSTMAYAISTVTDFTPFMIDHGVIRSTPTFHANPHQPHLHLNHLHFQ